MRRTWYAVVTALLVTALATPAAATVAAAHGPARAASPAAVTTLYQRWPVLEVGSAGANVRSAKYLLRARGYSVLTDPTYRAATATVVRHFQRDRGLTVTGTVNQSTWTALFVTLRAGSHGPAVSALQYQLWVDGFWVKATGTYDAATVTAVKHAQAAFGLTVDGIAGPATWSALVSHYLPATVVRKGTTTKKLVALTFDAGSDLGYTGQILDILAARGIKATFGLTGRWVEAHPAMAQRIVREGHEVANHTYSHDSFTGFSTGTAPLTYAQRRSQIDRGWAVIDATAGASFARWFRPPYGDRDASVDRDAGQLGYQRELMWTVDSLGWQGLAPDKVVARVVAAATPGEIVLMHVGSDSTDAAALPDIITRLKNLGYGFATASGVMG